VNLSGLRFAGVESSLVWQPAHDQSVRIGWTALFGAQDALHGLQSEYVFNYPVQNLRATWNWALPCGIALNNAVQIAERYQQTAYPVWDAAVVRNRGWMRPYLRLQNLSNTGYEEISGVAMPRRAIVGGISVRLGR
jgi:iron complex outermembrane receptor protein